MNEKLSYYIHSFTHLRRDAKNGGAPHQPILLLSLISLFNQGLFYNSEIRIIPEFVATFRSIWNKLVDTNHHVNFAMPFYALRTQKFWNLIPNVGCERWIKSTGSMKSFRNLTAAVNYAQIDKDLVDILLQPEGRDILKVALLNKYFPNSKNDFNDEGNLPDGLILYEESDKYKQNIIALKETLDDNEFHEEVFIRSGIFKREVPKLYNSTCAISGLRIDATANISLIDACHIVPFAEAYDDTISNGIALCPNLHRAFDRGLIAISDNYEVILSKNFVESTNSSYNISQFEQKCIHLPASTESYPSLENFKKHRERFGF